MLVTNDRLEEFYNYCRNNPADKLEPTEPIDTKISGRRLRKVLRYYNERGASLRIVNRRFILGSAPAWIMGSIIKHIEIGCWRTANYLTGGISQDDIVRVDVVRLIRR